MPSLRKFPRGGSWEVDTSDQELLVVDSDTCELRASGPASGDPAELVRRAALDPAEPFVRGRPRTLLCSPELKPRLKRVARDLGATLRASPELPALARYTAGPPVHLPETPEPWATAIAALVDAAPWQHLDDRICFRFHEAPDPLEDAVAVLLGHAGKQRGFIVYETTFDYEDFVASTQLGPDALGEEFLAWCAYLQPTGELPAPHIERAEQAGLVFGDLALELVALERDDARPLEPDEERACLSALQAVLGAYQVHGPQLPEIDDLVPVSTAAGVLRVDTVGMDDILAGEEPLVTAPHRVLFRVTETGASALVVKLAKSDARALAEQLEGVDGLIVEEGDPGEVDVEVFAGDEHIGTLCTAPDAEEVWDRWREHQGGELWIAGGGAQRSLRDSDIVARHDLAWLDSELEQLVAMYDPDWQDDARYDGPPETWPKASTVLLSFAEPLRVDELDHDTVEPALRLACTVWTAVVMADEGADPSFLRDIRASTAHDPSGALFEVLVQRKRRHFAQDTRLIRLDSVVWRGPGRVDVNCAWTMPKRAR